jgi:hypothetical protein
MTKNRVATLSAACLLAAMVLLPRAAFAVGEQVGRVRGVVTNATTGETLEGVTVEAASPTTIGQPRTTMTGRGGRYELINLPPGTYTVSFSYPGTVAATRKITLLQGESVALNLEYSLQSQETEEVTVTNRQLTRPDSAQTGGVREVSSANRLPTSRSYQGLVTQVPGTTGGANPNIKGGSTRQNKYLIDGLDVSDPLLSTFTQNLTFDSMQSVEVITGGMDAEYNALGGIINVLTRGGSDQFHSAASFYANHQSLSAKATYGPNLYEGDQPLNDAMVGANQSYQASLNVGGPILRSKLWYGATYEFDYTQISPAKSSPLGVPPYSIQHPARVFLGHMGRLSLNYQFSPQHRFWFSGRTDPATITNSDSGNTRLGVAEDRQKQGGISALAGWEWTINERLIPTVQAGFLYSFLDNGPMGWFDGIDQTGCKMFTVMDNCTYDPRRAQQVNTFDNTVWYQGGPVSFDRRYRWQIDPSVKIKAQALGTHALKLGLQTQILHHTWDWQRPGKSVFRDRSMMPLDAGLCDPKNPGPNCFLRIDDDPFYIEETGYGAGLYVQDRWWTPLSWLTVTPGVRLDWGYTHDWKNHRATSLFGVAPRLGANADLTQDGRNVAFAYYGRATEPISLLVASDTSSTEASITRVFRWSQPMMTWNQIDQQGGPGGIKVDPNAKMPHTDELTFGFRREIFPNTVGSIEYTWKRITNQWNLLEQNRIWDPSGSRVVDWVDPKTIKDGVGTQVFLYSTPDNPVWYRSFIFSTEGQPSRRWDYSASYVMSWTTFRDTPDNPRLQQFFHGYSSTDIRHFFRLYASYDLTDHLLVGGSLQYQSGTPLTKGFFNYEDGDYSNQRSPSGTTPSMPNDPKAISEFRIPDSMRLDLRLRYDVLPLRFQHRLQVVADIFNVLNQATPTGLTATDIMRYGQVTGRQAPRRIQLGLSYAY